MVHKNTDSEKSPNDTSLTLRKLGNAAELALQIKQVEAQLKSLAATLKKLETTKKATAQHSYRWKEMLLEIHSPVESINLKIPDELLGIGFLRDRQQLALDFEKVLTQYHGRSGKSRTDWRASEWKTSRGPRKRREKQVAG